MVVSINTPLPYAWEHAKLAYDEPHNSRDSEILDGADVIPMKNDTDFAYAAIYNHFATFSFKGTENWEQWKSNLDPYPLRGEAAQEFFFKPGEWGEGIIHDGFYTSWKFFKPCVDKIVEQYNLTNKKFTILIDGHSRGGALAELCARHLAKNRGITCSCIVFEAPGVGTKTYRDEFRSLTINGTRVENKWDPVPGLPPKALGFYHGCANRIWNPAPRWQKWLPISYRIYKWHLCKGVDKFIKKKFKGG